MEPQLLIASLHEHAASRGPAGHAGQHDFYFEDELGTSSPFDLAGVVIALLSMIGIMIAVAMMSGESAAPTLRGPTNPHYLMSTR